MPLLSWGKHYGQHNSHPTERTERFSLISVIDIVKHGLRLKSINLDNLNINGLQPLSYRQTVLLQSGD